MHALAFGTSFNKENLNKFLSYANEKLSFENIDFEHIVDISSNLDELTPNDILNMASTEILWGKGFEKPLVHIKNVRINKNQISLLSRNSKPTIKININGIEIMKFKSSEEEFNLICPNNDYEITTINIVGSCNINEWGGEIKPQIFIDDYEIVDKSFQF